MAPKRRRSQQEAERETPGKAAKPRPTPGTKKVNGGRPVATSESGSGGRRDLDPTAGQRLSGRRKWLFRLMAVTIVPALFFLAIEAGLRLFGYGYPTAFFVKLPDRTSYTTNPRFGWRFFPRAVSRAPVVCELPVPKSDDTYRIFVLGSSAAMGVPDSAFGFGRMLQAMLEECFPETRFEIVNTAMTAINSHVVLPIARECAQYQPDLFVVYTGNNEVVGPYGSGTVFRGFSPSLIAIRTSIFLRSTKSGQLLEQWLRRDGTLSEWQGMEMFMGNRVRADDPRMEKVYGHFRANLSDLCQVAGAAQTPVILCTVASNLVDNAPFASLHREDLGEGQRAQWEDLYRTGIARAEASDYPGAVESLAKAAAVDSHFAELHFRLAHYYLSLQQVEKARQHFIEARDLDVLRFRADSRINEVIREVAASGDERSISLVDTEAALGASEEASHGMPGRALFYEHVHLRPEGNYLLARAVFSQVVRLIPDSVRRHEAAAVVVPTRDRCFERLALTPWDRYRMQAEIDDMMDRPPFTSQLDHDRHRLARKKELEQLREHNTSPPALEKAAQAYATAMQLSPDDPNLQANYAKLLFERHDYERAAALWRKLLKRFPNVSRWRNEMGIVLKTQGRRSEAIEAFRETMRLDPVQAPWAHFNIGTVLLEQGQRTLAAEEFRQALAANPRLAMAYNSLGALLVQEGKTDEAKHCFLQAMEIQPNLAKAHSNLGYLLEREGKADQALQEYQRGLECDPNDLDMYRNLVALLVKQGKTREALEVQRRAATIAPDNADVHYRLGNLLALQLDFARAAEHFRTVLRLDPHHAKARQNLRAVLEKLGDKPPIP